MVHIEHNKIEKAPIILDFSGDVYEALRKLESILYTSGWNHYIIRNSDMPTEDRLLFSLIRVGALAVSEVYYTFAFDFTKELEERAYQYFGRLKKRRMDSIYLNAVNYFSKYEPDIDKTLNGALFYPSINAYVRCGDLSPTKLFELLRQDGCKRVIVFGNGIWLDKEQPIEEFHSFEMRVPKSHILEGLEKMQKEKLQAIHHALNKIESDFIPVISFPPVDEE